MENGQLNNKGSLRIINFLKREMDYAGFNGPHILCILILLLASCQREDRIKERTPDTLTSSEIPFKEALDQANIRQSQHDVLVKNALLIGNGDINGTIFSEGDDLIVNLSKNDVWDARLDTQDDPPLMKIDIENQRSAYEAEHHSTPPSWKNPYPCPRICAKLVISNVAPFDSQLNIQKALANVGNGKITIRSLAQDNIFLIDSKEQVDLRAISSSFLPYPETGTTNGIEWITQKLPPDQDWGGMSFVVAKAQQGERTFVSIATSLESSDPKSEAIGLITDALTKDNGTLITNHENIWEQFWMTSGLSLEDRELTNIWYRNLYFMRTVSKPGVQAVGLYAGSANDNALWHGSYTLDYNVEQTFWGPYVTNHVELSEPYERLIYDYLPRAKWFAKETYGINGAFYPVNIFGHESDPQSSRSVNKRMMAYVPWTYVPGLSGYAAKNIWLRYKYKPDMDYLKNIAYPILREASIFYCDFMDRCRTDKQGELLIGPTFSPEHGDFGVFNTPFDLAFIRFTFKAALEAAEILNTDKKLTSRIRKSLVQIPKYPTSGGSKSEIVDWPGDKPGREHNITTTSVPVFPAEAVTWFSKPEEKEIFKRTIQNMQWNGNNAMIMLGVARARLSVPETWRWMKNEFLARQQANGTLSLNQGDHNFNTFGIYSENFSSSGAISELLVQSVEDIIRVFPAWPMDKNGMFRNLRAQGGFLVSADQKNSSIEQIKIISTVGGKLQLFSPWSKIRLEEADPETLPILDIDDRGVIVLETRAGREYTFTENDSK